MTCGNKFAPGQYWHFCGETDMGQGEGARGECCGGSFKLLDPIQAIVKRKPRRQTVRLVYKRASVVATVVFTCSVCKVEAEGDSTTIEGAVTGGSESIIFDQSSARGSYAALMPVGWASYNGPVYKCPSCK